MTTINRDVFVRNTLPADFDGIIELCRIVYPTSLPWTHEQLASHLRIFPEGQFVAVDRLSGRILGMAASLIVRWDDYDVLASWREFTDQGWFTNHDSQHGRTLYGAEIMVDPTCRGCGIGKMIYAAREDLTRRLGLLRIRAGARLRGYSRYAARFAPEEYVTKVVAGEIGDPTLSFQLKRGFHVLAVVRGYLRHDPESLGYAAVIEWLNPAQATVDDWARLDPRFVPKTADVVTQQGKARILQIPTPARPVPAEPTAR